MGHYLLAINKEAFLDQRGLLPGKRVVQINDCGHTIYVEIEGDKLSERELAILTDYIGVPGTPGLTDKQKAAHWTTQDFEDGG